MKRKQLRWNYEKDHKKIKLFGDRVKIKLAHSFTSCDNLISKLRQEPPMVPHLTKLEIVGQVKVSSFYEFCFSKDEKYMYHNGYHDLSNDDSYITLMDTSNHKVIRKIEYYNSIYQMKTTDSYNK